MTTKPRVAVLKLGGRLSCGGLSAVGGEAVSLIKMLQYGFEVTAITKVLAKDKKNPCFFDTLQIEDVYDDINNMGFDILVVINGNVNFFDLDLHSAHFDAAADKLAVIGFAD